MVHHIKNTMNTLAFFLFPVHIVSQLGSHNVSLNERYLKGGYIVPGHTQAQEREKKRIIN